MDIVTILNQQIESTGGLENMSRRNKMINDEVIVRVNGEI